MHPRPYSLFVAVSLCNKGELLSIENRTKFTQVNVNPVRVYCVGMPPAGSAGLSKEHPSLRPYSQQLIHSMALVTVQDSGRPAAVWDEWIAFSVKIRDLLPTAQLSATVWHFSEGQAPAPLGGATMCLFSKKGRLKTVRPMRSAARLVMLMRGWRRACGLCCGAKAMRLRSSGEAHTPAVVGARGGHRIPVVHSWEGAGGWAGPDRVMAGDACACRSRLCARGLFPSKAAILRMGSRLQELCKRYDRGELAQIDWLDRLTFKVPDRGLRCVAVTAAACGTQTARWVQEVDRCIHHGQASQQDGAQGGRYLTVELPTFPQAVLYYQASLHPLRTSASRRRSHCACHNA